MVLILLNFFSKTKETLEYGRKIVLRNLWKALKKKMSMFKKIYFYEVSICKISFLIRIKT